MKLYILSEEEFALVQHVIDVVDDHHSKGERIPHKIGLTKARVMLAEVLPTEVKDRTHDNRIKFIPA